MKTFKGRLAKVKEAPNTICYAWIGDDHRALARSDAPTTPETMYLKKVIVGPWDEAPEIIEVTISVPDWR